MAKNDETRVDLWVDERVSALTVGDEWQPSLSSGLARLRERKTRAGRKRNWVLAAAVTTAVCLYMIVLPIPQAVVRRLWKDLFLERVDVVLVARPESAPNLTASTENSGTKAAHKQQAVAGVGDKAHFEARLWPILSMPVEIAHPSGGSFELVPASYETYFVEKDFPKTIESADSLLMLGDKADVGTRLLAVSSRVQAFSQLPANPSPDAEQLARERDAALQGVKLLQAFPKPADQTMSDEDFAKQKKPSIAFFYSAAAAASMQLKDNAGAVEFLKAALMNKPDDAVSTYALGLAYLGLTPPQELDGFWSLARAIDMRISQNDKVKDYLRMRILAYEKLGCSNQVEAQLTQLLQLAANSPERPATYMISCAGMR
jgi:hypothetical protein